LVEVTLRLAQTVSLGQFRRDKRYAMVLCYPRYDAQETTRRISELKRLGVKTLEFIGEKTVFNMPVLGKGCVGIVVAARADAKRVALKIRRVDADRLGMQHEAEMLKIANKIDVGPRLIGVSENFLLMEFIEGTLLPQWIEKLKEKGIKKRIRHVLRDVLEQCRILDEMGLDHGELSRAPKHIIIDSKDKSHIVDFETASTMRRTSNVTSICQFLFLGSQLAKTLKRRLGEIDKEALVATLRDYKLEQNSQNFIRILQACRLM